MQYANILKLTKSQNKTFLSFIDFINNDHDIMIIRGSAGTGKTTLLNKLINHLYKDKKEFSLWAPTGRAVKILQEKTNNPAITIHKGIYTLTGIFGDISSGNIKHIFNIRNNNEDTEDHIYFIDESSMISDIINISDSFSFGTGNLLADIFSYTNVNSKTNNRKIVFIGDSFQLPPVKSLESPSLNKSYLQLNYKLKVISAELKEIVRQESKSAILKNAHIIRDKNNKKPFRTLNLKTEKEVKKCNINNLCDLYEDIDIESNIIIAQTNNSVDNYNKIVRNFIFKNQSNQIEYGEKLLITENNYNYPVHLMNGDFVKVQDVINREFRTIKLRGREPITLSFTDLKINLLGAPNSIATFDVKVLNNLLKSEQSFLNRELRAALLVDLIQRNKNIKPNSIKFQELMKKDSYYNCLKVKYAYAITCHKAQGGEWNNAIVDLRSTNLYISNEYRRWLYTAITRAKNNLYLLNTELLKDDLFSTVMVKG